MRQQSRRSIMVGRSSWFVPIVASADLDIAGFERSELPDSQTKFQRELREADESREVLNRRCRTIRSCSAFSSNLGRCIGCCRGRIGLLFGRHDGLDFGERRVYVWKEDLSANGYQSVVRGWRDFWWYVMVWSKERPFAQPGDCCLAWVTQRWRRHVRGRWAIHLSESSLNEHALRSGRCLFLECIDCLSIKDDGTQWFWRILPREVNYVAVCNLAISGVDVLSKGNRLCFGREEI